MTKSVRKKAQRTKLMPPKQPKLPRVSPPKELARIGRVLTSQEIAKDPDPATQKPVEQTTDEDQSQPEIHWSLSEDVTLETLHDAVRLFGKQGGNSTFNGILQKHPDRWGLTCDGSTE